MAISVSGLGSGLDIDGIITQLMAVERQPLLKLASREAEFQAKISAVGSLKGALSAFQQAIAKLGDADTFEAVTTSSSAPEVVTLSASSDAAYGGMAIEVNRVAQAHKLASAAKASADTFGGTAGDQLTFTVGAESITIDLSSAKTLQQIREEITAAGGDIGLSATLLDETGDGSAMRLVLSSSETGYDGRVQVAFDGSIDADTFGFATINTDADGAVLVDLAELDANFSLDGFSLTRSSNSVDDAISGVTFELLAPGSAQLNVSRDTAAVGQALSGLVDAYNKLQDTLTGLGNGGLSGDGITRSVANSVRSALGSSFAGLGEVSNLSQLGVSFTKEGRLSFDKAKLGEAMAADRSAVEAFFTDASGLFGRLDGVLSGYLDSKGILDARVDGLNARIDSLQDQQERWQDRLVTVEARLRAQFTALDGLVARLNSTSQYLAQQLDNLPGFTDKSSG